MFQRTASQCQDVLQSAGGQLHVFRFCHISWKSLLTVFGCELSPLIVPHGVKLNNACANLWKHQQLWRPSG